MKILYQFPYEDIKQGEKVILYGGGNVCKSFLEQIEVNDYCKVIYLDRTEGISSTEVRTVKSKVKIGLVGENNTDLTSLDKFLREIKYVNGAVASCSNKRIGDLKVIEDYDWLLDEVDAVYITSHPSKHFEQVRKEIGYS